MKIFLASGYTVMNIKGRERYMANQFGNWKRLISFFDLKRENRVMNVINLKK
jgi:hypothetical protein